jgi:hypothetical protein
MGEYMRALQQGAGRQALVDGGHAASGQIFQALSDLYFDFTHSACETAKLLISELHLPVKTISPLSLGGVAGGKKYIHGGILFKFAEDPQLGSSFLYGGSAPDVGKANKAAGHEQKSSDAICNAALELQISMLNVPLMTLVDYRGYRVVAMALLPVTKGTLVLGSNDGGETVMNCDEEARETIVRVCDLLGLVQHCVAGVMCPGPGDLEIHRGTDGRIYALDFARLFPPEHSGLPKLGHEIFYSLLRAEAVRNAPIKLCSDALTGWGRHDPNWKEHNRHLKEYSDHLRITVAHECALALSKHFDSMNNLLIAPGRTEYDVVNMSFRSFRLEQIVKEMHPRGLGMRMLNCVRKQSQSPRVRLLLLTEMARRTVSLEIDTQLRNAAEVFKYGYESPFQALVVGYVDMVLGCKGADSVDFWSQRLLSMMEAKYGAIDFRPDDTGAGDERADLSMCLSVPLLLCGLEKRFGMDVGTQELFPDSATSLVSPIRGLLAHPLRPILTSNSEREFFRPRVKFSNMSHWVRGRALLATAMGELRAQLALHYCLAAGDALVLALEGAPCNTYILCDALQALISSYALTESETIAKDMSEQRLALASTAATLCDRCIAQLDRFPPALKWRGAATIAAGLTVRPGYLLEQFPSKLWDDVASYARLAGSLNVEGTIAFWDSCARWVGVSSSFC